MKRRFFSVIAIALIAILATGCMRIESSVDTTKKKNEYVMTTSVWFNKQMVDQIAAGDYSSIGLDSGSLSEEEASQMSMMQPVMAEFQKGAVVTIDGREYYTSESQKTSGKFFNGKVEDGPVVTKTSFYASSASEVMDSETSDQVDQAGEYMSKMIEKVQISVKFKDKVNKTNGKLSKNKKTVTFNYNAKSLTKKKKTEMYAYTESSERTLAEDRALFKTKK